MAALAASAIVFVVSGFDLTSHEVTDSVEVIGHRGAAGKRPENTMAAFEKAIEDGADWIELDVQESADGEVIVVHDSDFMKLAGHRLKVWDATAEMLADIDIGSWFSPEYADQRTPTLREALLLAKGTPAGVLIELKYYGHDETLEERVAALTAFHTEVAAKNFPYPETNISMHENEKDKFLEALDKWTPVHS